MGEAWWSEGRTMDCTGQLWGDTSPCGGSGAQPLLCDNPPRVLPLIFQLKPAGDRQTSPALRSLRHLLTRLLYPPEEEAGRPTGPEIHLLPPGGDRVVSLWPLG